MGNGSALLELLSLFPRLTHPSRDKLIRIIWGALNVTSVLLGVFFGITYYDDRSVHSIVFVCDTMKIDSLNPAAYALIQLKNPNVDWISGFWTLSYYITFNSPGFPLVPYVQQGNSSFSLSPLESRAVKLSVSVNGLYNRYANQTITTVVFSEKYTSTLGEFERSNSAYPGVILRADIDNGTQIQFQQLMVEVLPALKSC